MTLLKAIITILFFLAMNFNIHGQDVVKWNFTAKKISEGNYEIHLTPTIKDSWHLYSQSSPEDAALPTKINFNKNPLVSLEGKTNEIGKQVSKYEEVFETTVKYLEGKVDFVQVMKLKKKVKTNISGTIEYMACKEGQCTPPLTVNFNIALE